MSLTYTSALCADGRWYKNPVWRGTSQFGNEFFICLDDDDPPELVVRDLDKSKILDGVLIAKSILEQLGIAAEINEKSFMKSGRCFVRERLPEEGRGPKPSKIHQAFRFFLFIKERPPAPTHFDKLWDDQPPEGVKYYFTTPPLLTPNSPMRVGL